MPFLLPINSAKSEKISGCANSRIKTLESYWGQNCTLTTPAIFLQDLFQFLLYFNILKMKKKFLTFLTIPPKDM